MSYWKTIGNKFYHTKRWYYDDYKVTFCWKCKKEIDETT